MVCCAGTLRACLSIFWVSVGGCIWALSQAPAYVLIFRSASPVNKFCCLQVRALYSATLPESVEDLARSVLKDPLRIVVGVPALPM